MENTMNHANKLSGLIALAAAVAMPMAFAQTAPTTDDGMQPTSPQATAPTAEPKQVTWADLDDDKHGSLRKAEVATVPALPPDFDPPDADAAAQPHAAASKPPAPPRPPPNPSRSPGPTWTSTRTAA